MSPPWLDEAIHFSGSVLYSCGANLHFPRAICAVMSCVMWALSPLASRLLPLVVVGTRMHAGAVAVCI